MFVDGCHQCGEVTGVAEHAAADGIEDLGQLRVELEVAIEMAVTELVDVFGQVPEKEDVLFADFAGDFDLCQLY